MGFCLSRPEERALPVRERALRATSGRSGTLTGNRR